MINGDVNMFVEDLHYGQFMCFVFKNKTYITEGGKYEGDDLSTLWLMTVEQDEKDVIYHEFKKKTLWECAEEFLQAPIFDNKTFWEVEKDIVWVDDEIEGKLYIEGKIKFDENYEK